MKKVIGLSLALGMVVVFLFVSVGFGEDKGTTNLESLYNEMSIEELEESEALLLRILNEKKVAGAVLIIEPASVEVAIGRTANLAVSSDGREITRKTRVEYESADPSIADVKAGVVTAKSPGTVKIKASATFEDGAVLEAFSDITVFVPVTALKTTGKGSVFTGETLDIASLVTITPENATEKGLKFEVNDTDTATISDEGILTGKKAGTVTVTITSKENVPTPKATKIAVTVNQAVTSITLSNNQFELGKGKSNQMTATVGPDDATNKKVTWTSDDPKIASVSANGTVTGTGTGTTTIKCTAADGSGITATAKVTVITSVASLKMEKKQMTVLVWKDSTNSCTVSPADATNKKLTWSSSDISIATVSATGTVTGKRAGTCIITATATDGSKATASYTLYVEPTVPVKVTSIHWQTTWGVNNGKMGVEAENQCVHATVRSFDYIVKCYIGSITSDPAVSYLSYDGKPIAPGGTGKSRLTSSSVSGFKSASFITIIPTTVYFSDGTSMRIENAEDYASSFDMR